MHCDIKVQSFSVPLQCQVVKAIEQSGQSWRECCVGLHLKVTVGKKVLSDVCFVLFVFMLTQSNQSREVAHLIEEG